MGVCARAATLNINAKAINIAVRFFITRSSFWVIFPANPKISAGLLRPLD
jgi:hypothetical protein